MSSILDAPLRCSKCGKVARAGDCEPDVDGDGGLGCPVPDCGGVMGEAKTNEVKAGDTVRFKEEPPTREWAWGKDFLVTEVRTWGILCYTIINGGEAHYRAMFDQIKEIIPFRATS